MCEESLNTVLVQELARYQGLLHIIRSTVKDLQAVFAGKRELSGQLQDISVSFSTTRCRMNGFTKDFRANSACGLPNQLDYHRNSQPFLAARVFSLIYS